jgi:Cytochrome P460
MRRLIKMIRRASASSALLLLSMYACSSPNPATSPKLNDEATLRGELPTNPLQWKVISMMINRAESTMSTLYGNDVAVEYVRTNPKGDYPAGSQLALVTWTQQEDPRWFGAKIPASVKSVEFVTVEKPVDGHSIFAYKKFEGKPLKEMSQPASKDLDGRISFIASQRAAVLP